MTLRPGGIAASLLLLALGLVPPLTASAESIPAPDALDPVTFVKQRYVHGIPFREARLLPRSAVPELLALLADPENEPYLATIVVTVGIIGDARATPPLIRFLERASREVSLARFNALLSVPTALGHLAREGDPKALGYLLARTSPSRWAARRVRWSFGRYSGQARDLLLTKLAVNGLAASGRMEAYERLTRLRDFPESPAVGEAIESNVREGIEFNLRVRVEGADRAFGGSRAAD
jgi:HEAT repeat protein